MIIVSLIVTGFIVGLFSSFFGIGGGAFMIPALYTLFKTIDPKIVIASCLGVMFLTSSLNLYNYYRLKISPKLKLSIFIGMSAILGSSIGTYLLKYISGDILKQIVGTLLLVSFVRLILQRSSKPTYNSNPNILFMMLIGLLGGIISGLTGLGGGLIFVPLLIVLARISTLMAPVYSNVGMLSGSGFAFILHLLAPLNPASNIHNIASLQIGNANFFIIIFILLGSSISSRFGSRFLKTANPTIKKWIFAVLLLILGLKLLLFS